MSRICHILGDSKYGGGSKVVLGLCGRALADGHEVFVLTTDPLLGDEVDGIGGHAVRLDCIRRATRPFWDLVGLIRLVRHLRDARYDLVHTHTSKAGMIGRLAGKLSGTRAIVHTVHGFAFHEQSQQAVVYLIAGLERVAARWCDRVVTVSRYHREWALRLHISEAEKIVAIPNGIAPMAEVSETNRRAIREGLGVGDDELLALSLGRLAPQKGFEYLIAAVPSIRGRTDLPVRFFIAGDGPGKSELKNAIEHHGVGDVVKLIGFSHDVAGLLAAADLVIQPSLWEGLSISLLEAMSAGKAIVTTAIESNKEIVGESGCAVLIPACDPEALAAATADLINDEASRRRISATARSVFAAEYTCNRMHDNYMELYCSLLPPVPPLPKRML